MENTYIIKGGQPLKGEVKLSGAKNVALKVIIASLLFDSPVHLSNIPHILDIEELMHLIRLLGGKASFDGVNDVIIDPTGIKKESIDLLHASKIRASFMLFAPLLYHFGRAKIPNPGGCRLGARPIDRTIKVMESFGIKIQYGEDGYYRAYLKGAKIHGARHTFPKATHTGTEFALLLSCLALGESVLYNVSTEPEIDDLIDFLNSAGAKIKRSDNKIVVQGVTCLKMKQPYSIQNDRNEAATYASFALSTKGDVRILGIKHELLTTFIDQVRQAGAEVSYDLKNIRFAYKKALKAVDIVTHPHPGFMTDWQGPWAVLMTQAQGVSTIHETIFENRFSYVEELKKLGARIEFYEPKVKNPEEFYEFNYTESKKKVPSPQAIRIYGETKLHNGVLNVSDLRAGASLLIAAAVASGESIVNGASVIDRGYEAIDIKLRLLGAKIKKI